MRERVDPTKELVFTESDTSLKSQAKSNPVNKELKRFKTVIRERRMGEVIIDDPLDEHKKLSKESAHHIRLKNLT